MPARLTLPAGLILAAAGIAICSYLVSQHYVDRTLVCGPVGDCEYVQESEYATMAGVPIAALGLALYLGVASAALAGLFARWRTNAIAVFFSLTLAGALYSVYLTYLELFVLDAICMWCVVSAANFVLLLALALLCLRAVADKRPGAAMINRRPSGVGSR